MRAAPLVGGDPEPLAASQHVLLARLDERQRLGVPSAPVRQHDRGAQRQVTAGGLDDGVRLGGQRHGHPDPAGEQLDEHAVGERDGQRGERAGAARELEMARGELVPRLIIGQRPGDAAGQPQPAQLVLLGEPLVPERAQRDLQRRRPRNVALAGEEGEPVQQQIAGARRGLPVGGQNGRRDLARIARRAPGGRRRAQPRTPRGRSRARASDPAARAAWPPRAAGGERRDRASSRR